MSFHFFTFGMVVLIVVYGLLWHDKPAPSKRPVDQDEEDHDRLDAVIGLQNPHIQVRIGGGEARSGQNKPLATSHRAATYKNDRPAALKAVLMVLALASAFSASAQDLALLSSGWESQMVDNSSWVNTSPAPFQLWNAGVSFGAGFGMREMGSTQAHDIAATILHLGTLLGPGDSLWNSVELAGELWTGAQFSPKNAYLVGLTPIVRYHLHRDSRWRPFFDVGAGVTATDIGGPDLSTTFEFNLQAGVGFHWILRENTAFTFQVRYVHLSNARIDTPNLGVNSMLFSGGFTWFF